MALFSGKVTMRLNIQRELGKVIASGLMHPEINEMAQQWAEDYKAFIRARYQEQSEGGGEWPPVKASTIIARARRAQGSKGARRNAYGKFVAALNALIMIDTREVFSATAPGVTRGWKNAYDRYGVTVGFSGTAMHRSGRASIAQIVRWHHSPGPGARYPARKIMVPPDEQTKAKFRDAALKALRKIKRRNGGK